MAGNNNLVFATFSNRSNAETAVTQLTNAGFSSQEISALRVDTGSTQAIPNETDTNVSPGVAIGGATDSLAEIGALSIPGVGQLLTAGPLVASLTRLGVAGATGGLVAALVGLGIPSSDAQRYGGSIGNGGLLLAVPCATPQQLNSAQQTLRSAGAEDVVLSTQNTNPQTSTNNETDLVASSISGSRAITQIPVEEADRQHATVGEASTSRTTYY